MRIPAEDISPRDSDTRRVAARLIPEVAKVMANPYTVDMSVKSPIASAPTVLDIYTLKDTPAPLISRETAVRRSPLKMNFLNLFISVFVYSEQNFLYNVYENEPFFRSNRRFCTRFGFKDLVEHGIFRGNSVKTRKYSSNILYKHTKW